MDFPNNKLNIPVMREYSSKAEKTSLKSPRHINELDSLRGWAIMFVLIFHYAGMIGPVYLWPINKSDTLQALSLAGNTGVSLFFVISGFLLTRPFLHRLSEVQPLLISRFFIARALRILPLYLVVVVSAWVITGNNACVKAMLFIPIGFQAFPFSVPWWSLSTEVQFYLLLPLIMFSLSFRALRPVVLASLVAGMAIYAFLLQATDILERFPLLTNSLPDRASAFFGGGMAAWLTTKRTGANLPPGVASFLLLLALSSLTVILHWYGSVGHRQVLHEFPLFHYLEALLWSTVLFSLIQPYCILKAVACNPLFDWIGRISYSIYLLHMPIIFYVVYPTLTDVKSALVSDTQLSAALAFSFLAILAASWVSYRIIELPFLDLKSRWFGNATPGNKKS